MGGVPDIQVDKEFSELRKGVRNEIGLEVTSQGSNLVDIRTDPIIQKSSHISSIGMNTVRREKGQ
jgi:hypothetical protein